MTTVLRLHARYQGATNDNSDVPKTGSEATKVVTGTKTKVFLEPTLRLLVCFSKVSKVSGKSGLAATGQNILVWQLFRASPHVGGCIFVDRSVDGVGVGGKSFEAEVLVETSRVIEPLNLTPTFAFTSTFTLTLTLTLAFTSTYLTIGRP